MSESRDPERTESATTKRRNEARNKGSVPKSGELSKLVVVLAGMIATRYSIGIYDRELREIFRWFLSDGMRIQITANTAHLLLMDLSWRLAKMLLPTLLVLAACSYTILRLQVGELWVLPWQNWNWGKLFTPSNILGKLKLNMRAWVNLGRQCAQAAAIGIAPYIVLKNEFGNIMPLFYTTPSALAGYILSNAMTMLWYTMLPMAIIAAIDTWWTRYDYEENLKMTKHEVKDERKQAEGDPIIKNKRLQKMMAMMAQRMLKNVPKADVVITNPTHIAVALQYNPLLAPAPIVVAMGADHLAKKIREIARENNVPIRENKPLARALYKDAEVGEMIPEALFQAVAAVLAQLDRFRKGRPSR